MTTSDSLPSIKPSHYHQIYEGQKFFWRQRLNVDLNILHHQSEHYLEIIPYNSDLSLELNHLFINSTVLYGIIQSEINNKVAEMKKDLSKDRFKKVPPDQELFLKVSENLMSQFILNRLIAVNENNINYVRLSLLSADSFDLSTLIIEKTDTEIKNEDNNPIESIPSTDTTQQQSSSSSLAVSTSNATPKNSTNNTTNTAGKQFQKDALPITPKGQVKINRRRKTASGEFDQVLANLRQHSQELNEACDRASKLTELSSKSVDSFKNALANRYVKYDKTKPIERFKWAVKRVILNNTVERIRKQLEKRARDKQPLRINATFPLPDGSIINPANAAAQLQRIPLLTKIHEAYSTGPSPFQSPIVTPRGKQAKNNSPPGQKGMLTKSPSTSEVDSMPAVNQRQKSAGRILMASSSLPSTAVDGNISTTLSTSPTNQSNIHLPSLKDTNKSPAGKDAAASSTTNGNSKERKKSVKK